MTAALLAAVAALREDADGDREGYELSDGSVDCGVKGALLAAVFEAAEEVAQRAEMHPGDQIEPRFAEDYPEALWWCRACAGLVRCWGLRATQSPPPRCPGCHAFDFHPVPWLPSSAHAGVVI